MSTATLVKEVLSIPDEFKLNPKEYTRLIDLNPVQALSEYIGWFAKHDGSDYAMIYLLEKQESDCLAFISTPDRDEFHYGLQSMYDLIKSTVSNLLNSDKVRPADVGRRFLRVLRWMKKRDVIVNHLIRDILLKNTLPEDELLSPDWVDGYTGEVDLVKDPFIKNVPMSETTIPDTFEHIGYDLDTTLKALKAQDGFDASADEDDWVEERLAPDQQPMWKTVAEEMQLSSEYPILRAELAPIIKDCHEHVDTLTQLHEDQGTLKSTFVQADFRHGPYAKEFLDQLQSYADQDCSLVDLAVLFLSLQNGYMFAEEDASKIKVTRGEFEHLGEFIELFADELASGDALPRGKELTGAELDKFITQTIEDYVARDTNLTPQANGYPDITKSPEYLEGFYRGLIESDIKSAIKDGWTNWRQSKSVRANTVYNQEIAKGASNKDAMKKFWATLNWEKNRPTVARLFENGVRLSNGSLLKYDAFIQLVTKDSINFPGDTRQRIKAALVKSQPNVASRM